MRPTEASLYSEPAGVVPSAYGNGYYCYTGIVGETAALDVNACISECKAAFSEDYTSQALYDAEVQDLRTGTDPDGPYVAIPYGDSFTPNSLDKCTLTNKPGTYKSHAKVNQYICGFILDSAKCPDTVNNIPGSTGPASFGGELRNTVSGLTYQLTSNNCLASDGTQGDCASIYPDEP